MRTAGRIRQVRRLGGVEFAILSDGLDQIQLVLEAPETRVRRGHLVEAEGLIREIASRKELLVADLVIVQMPDPDSAGARATLEEVMDPRREEAQRMRVVATQVIHRFLAEESFAPIQSPSLTGPWVKGETGSFKTSFGGAEAYLSISNMLYHQMALATRFHRVYELGKLHRDERPSSRRRLAEFTVLDIGQAWSDLDLLVALVERLIQEIHQELASLNNRFLRLPERVSFDRIAYTELLAAVGAPAKAVRLPTQARRWLAKEFPGFVWVYGSPRSGRPFYMKADGETCNDVQLWFNAPFPLAAGGERECCREQLERRLRDAEKDPSHFEFYLSALSLGAPPMCGIGMGLERFLAVLACPADAADFSFFPRYAGRLDS